MFSGTMVENCCMANKRLDEYLYRWISVANERAERYSFPPGLIEESVQVLKVQLGEDYLMQIFEGSENLHLLGLRGQELDRWLRGGANVDDHVIQVLDLAALLREFKEDPFLEGKVGRLKRSSFWPSQFELAMALRAKRVIGTDGSVRLSRETNTAVGDFIIDWKQGSIACECARLAFGEEEEEQYRLVGDLYHYTDHQIKKSKRPCCVKIRVRGPLIPTAFTATIRCLKGAFSHFGRTNDASHEVEGIQVTIEPLTGDSERIPFRYIDGRVQDIRSSEWVMVQSLSYVNARDGDEAAAMYRAGVDLVHDEYARVFLSWERNPADIDPYARIQNKVKKKRHQTKAEGGTYGRIIFLESQWDVDLLDTDRLRPIIDHELDGSRNTITVVLAQRCASVHYRRWYKFVVSKVGTSYAADSALLAFLERMICYDRDFDPILNQRYLRTWEQAAELASQHEVESDAQERLREGRL
jgi:hypothetical protein